MTRHNDTSEDFENSAKNAVRLIQAKLACGAESEAVELVRGMLVEAHRMGMRKVLKSEGLI